MGVVMKNRRKLLLLFVIIGIVLSSGCVTALDIKPEVSLSNEDAYNKLKESSKDIDQSPCGRIHDIQLTESNITFIGKSGEKFYYSFQSNKEPQLIRDGLAHVVEVPGEWKVNFVFNDSSARKFASALLYLKHSYAQKQKRQQEIAQVPQGKGAGSGPKVGGGPAGGSGPDDYLLVEYLIDVAGVGDLSEVQALLAEGANVNAKDREGHTPLMNAAANGHLQVVQALIAHGAQIEAQNYLGLTALMAAAGKGHLQVVQSLLACGANVNVRSQKGWTALMLANRQGHTEVANALHRAGAR